MLLKPFLGLFNMSEYHLMLLLKFYGVLYTPNTMFIFKNVTATPKFSIWTCINAKIYLTYFQTSAKGFWRARGFLPVSEIVNHIFILFLVFHYITCHSLNRHTFYTIRDIHLKFTDRICIWFVIIWHEQFLSHIAVRKCHNGTVNRDIFSSKCAFAMRSH